MFRLICQAIKIFFPQKTIKNDEKQFQCLYSVTRKDNQIEKFKYFFSLVSIKIDDNGIIIGYFNRYSENYNKADISKKYSILSAKFGINRDNKTFILDIQRNTDLSIVQHQNDINRTIAWLAMVDFLLDSGYTGSYVRDRQEIPFDQELLLQQWEEVKRSGTDADRNRVQNDYDFYREQFLNCLNDLDCRYPHLKPPEPTPAVAPAPPAPHL